MDKAQGRGRRRWHRLSIGTAMLFVGVSAVFLSVVRPVGPSVQARLAVQVIEAQMPGFRANRYRVVDEVKSADGRYWRIRFRGADGKVKGDELTAIVPDGRVQATQKAPRR